MSLKEKNIQALISLLDDSDEEVFKTVSRQLMEVGYDGLSFLEKAQKNADSLVLHDRLGSIILYIEQNSIAERFEKWLMSDNRNLLDGWILLSSLQFPNISKDAVYKLFHQLVNEVWIELNESLTSLEKTSVINHILFDRYRFEISKSLLGIDELKSNCIRMLLASRQGNGLSLLLLYYLVGKNLNLPIHVISFRNNLLLAYYDPEVASEAFGKDADPYLFYINPEHKGAIIGYKELEYSFKKEMKQNFKDMCSTETELDLVKRLAINFKEIYISIGHFSQFNAAEKIILLLQTYK